VWGRVFGPADRGDILTLCRIVTISFTAIKTVKKPTRVKFETKSGETVSFKTIKQGDQNVQESGSCSFPR
jgi:hypothetical protein